MSTGNVAAAVLCLLGGLAGAIQVAIMGRFGDRIGVAAAFAFSTAGTALIAAVALVATRGPGGYADALRQPAWLWLGGAMGALVVFSITLAAPRIGGTATIGILIAGQLAMGAVIDRYGLFGLERIELSWPRLLGIALLGIGAALSLAR